MSKRLVGVLAGVLILVAGCSGFLLQARDSTQPEASAANVVAAPLVSCAEAVAPPENTSVDTVLREADGVLELRFRAKDGSQVAYSVRYADDTTCATAAPTLIRAIASATQ